MINVKEAPSGATGDIVGKICVCTDYIKPGQAVSQDENGMYHHSGCHFREMTTGNEDFQKTNLIKQANA